MNKYIYDSGKSYVFSIYCNINDSDIFDRKSANMCVKFRLTYFRTSVDKVVSLVKAEHSISKSRMHTLLSEQTI